MNMPCMSKKIFWSEFLEPGAGGRSQPLNQAVELCASFSKSFNYATTQLT